jgi:hypothetical protein
MAHQCAPCFGVIESAMVVIPSRVENGAAGEAATWTGRPEAERAGVSESNPVAERNVMQRDVSSLRMKLRLDKRLRST